MSYSKIKKAYQEAQELEKSGKVPSAVDLLNQALLECSKFTNRESDQKNNSNKRRLYQLKAHLLEKNNQISEAAQIYEQLIQANHGLASEKTGMIFLKAISCFSKLENFSKVEKYCQEALNQNGISPVDKLQIALKHFEVLRTSKKAKNAKENLQKFWESQDQTAFSTNDRVLVGMKLLRAETEELEDKSKAIELLNSLNEKDVQDSSLKLMLIYEKAKALEKLKMREELKSLIDQKEREGLLEKGETKYSAQILYIGACNEMELGNVEKSLEGLDRARKLIFAQPANQSSRNYAFVTHAQMKCAVFLNKFETAKKILKEAEGHSKFDEFWEENDLKEIKKFLETEENSMEQRKVNQFLRCTTVKMGNQLDKYQTKEEHNHALVSSMEQIEIRTPTEKMSANSSGEPQMAKKLTRGGTGDEIVLEDNPFDDISRLVAQVRESESLDHYSKVKSGLKALGGFIPMHANIVSNYIEENELSYLKFFIAFNLYEEQVDVKKVEELYFLEKKANENKGLATKILLLLGKMKLKAKEYKEAKQYFKKALKNSKKEEELALEKIESYYYWCKILAIKKKRKRFQELAKKGLSECSQNNSSPMYSIYRAKLLFLLANNLKNKKKFEKSANILKSAIDLLEGNPEFSKADRIEFNFEFCGVLFLANKLKEAQAIIPDLLTNLQECEKNSDIDEICKELMIASILYYDAEGHLSTGKPEKAAELGEGILKRINEFQLAGDWNCYSLAFDMLGRAHRKLGNFEKSIESLKAAYDEFKKSSNENKAFLALLELGHVYCDSKNKGEAKAVLSACKETAQWGENQKDYSEAVLELRERVKRLG